MTSDTSAKPYRQPPKPGEAMRARTKQQMIIDLDKIRGKNPRPGTPLHARMIALSERLEKGK